MLDNQLTEKKKQLVHIRKAREFFKDNDDILMNSQQKWVTYLNGHDLEISDSTLSNHFTGDRHDFKNTGVYKKIINKIDAYINNKYSLNWDVKSQDYVQGLSIKSDNTNELLSGLNGVWKGYSWKKDGYDGNANKDKRDNCYAAENCIIDVFKLEIMNGHDVLFNSVSEYTGVIKLIGSGRFYIDLTAGASDRKTFMIGSCGPIKSKEILHLTLAYADSGIDNVKSGICVIHRKNYIYKDLKAGQVSAKDVNKQIFQILSGGDHYHGTQHYANVDDQSWED